MKKLNEYGVIIKNYLNHKNLTQEDFNKRKNMKAPIFLYARSAKKLTENVIIDTISTMERISKNNKSDANYIFQMKRYHVRFLQNKVNNLAEHKDKICKKYADECMQPNIIN